MNTPRNKKMYTNKVKRSSERHTWDLETYHPTRDSWEVKRTRGEKELEKL